MLIKNVSERPLTIAMETRTIQMRAEDEVPVSATEVLDPVLREHLQVRTIAVVRPATDEENDAAEQEAETGA